MSSSRAGDRYWRGSNLSGFWSMNWRTIAVIARRPSESMLILHTADLAARRSCSSGMPIASLSLPPWLLMIVTYSCGTDDDPCSTIGNPGICFSICSRMSNRSGGGSSSPASLRVHCSGVNLLAPCDVPIDIASESTPVRVTNSITSSGWV